MIKRTAGIRIGALKLKGFLVVPRRPFGICIRCEKCASCSMIKPGLGDFGDRYFGYGEAMP